MMKKPAITIKYCVQCNWLLRAAWMAQELLNSFADELESVTLEPGSSGVYQITAGEKVVWERKRDGGFPDAVALKQRICALYFPDKAPAHGGQKKS